MLRVAVGPEGRVIPEQWLIHTAGCGVAADDRRRLDFVVYGATAGGHGLYCDATRAASVARNSSAVSGAARDGVSLETGRRRKRARCHVKAFRCPRPYPMAI